MKTVYIPKGETVSYEAITTERLVVKGKIIVQGEIKAKSISGNGVISAGLIHADTIVAEDIETTTIVCEKLIAKRVSAAEMIASKSAAVSCFLSSAYVETPKLTVALSEISEIKCGEVINLKPKHSGLFMTLLLSFVRSLWLTLTTPIEVYDAEYETVEDDSDPEVKAEVAETVQNIMDEDDDDFELKRFVSIFKLLRDSGYTLKIVPGTPEENAPKASAVVTPFRKAA